MIAKKNDRTRKKSAPKKNTAKAKPTAGKSRGRSAGAAGGKTSSAKTRNVTRVKKRLSPSRSAAKPKTQKPVLTRERLTGWGRHDRAWTLGFSPGGQQALSSAARMKEPEHRIARARGRAYGDAAMNDGGLTVHFDRLDRVADFDVQKGLLIAEAGMTLIEILRLAVPRGWFLPVTPGTAFPSLGGSIACDVHGKNHHRAGTIGAHLEWIELITADGELVRCGPKRNKALFRATVGGMGLTGLIYRAALNLLKIETSYIVEESIRVGNLREMMERLSVSDATHPYTVAWMDAAASGARLGQGHVLLGRHAKLTDLPVKSLRDPLVAGDGRALPVPAVPPFSFVNNVSIRTFNTLRLQMAPRGGKTRIVPYTPFFYPLDAASDWNRIYGPRGFYQYQYVVPFDGAEEVLRETLIRLQKAGTLPSLVVLKRFGEEGEGLLSFPKAGWTIALDIPVSAKLDSVLDELDALLLEAKGRIYLAKDARLKPESFRNMYPRFEEWLKVKREIDPQWRFSSNLSRRLKMEERV